MDHAALNSAVPSGGRCSEQPPVMCDIIRCRCPARGAWSRRRCRSQRGHGRHHDHPCAHACAWGAACICTYTHPLREQVTSYQLPGTSIRGGGYPGTYVRGGGPLLSRVFRVNRLHAYFSFARHVLSALWRRQFTLLSDVTRMICSAVFPW